MSTKLHFKGNVSVPSTLGTQFTNPAMDVRPKIQRRVPNMTQTTRRVTPQGVQQEPTKPHRVTPQGVQQEPTKPHRVRDRKGSAELQQRTPSITSQGDTQRQQRPPSTRSQVEPRQQQRLTSTTSLRQQQRPGSTTSTHEPEGQDVRFIDVPSTGIPKSARGYNAKDTYSIVCTDVLEKCQESEYDQVYDIDLHGSQITVIDNLDRFTKVRVLDLSCNYISRIDNLKHNTDIRELKLYDNDIETIENLDALKELSILQLQHNRIRIIGKGLQNQRRLRVLRLDSNCLCHLEVREVASCGQLTTVDLSNNKLDSVAAISCLTSLEELYVVNNRLRTITDLSRCKKLQEVDVSQNKLTELSGLKGLSNLTILHASHNHIAGMKSLGKLKGLQELNIAANRLSEVKSLVEYYPGLQILDISENMLESWPAVCNLAGLKELVELYISGNPFCSANGPHPHYPGDLYKLLPNLELLDGAQLKKMSSHASMPLMRPMSAASILTSRQVECQLLALDDEMMDFERNISERFESVRSTMTYLPKDSDVGPKLSSLHLTSIQHPGECRPSSKSGKRSRIKLALEFAANEDILENHETQYGSSDNS